MVTTLQITFILFLLEKISCAKNCCTNLYNFLLFLANYAGHSKLSRVYPRELISLCLSKCRFQENSYHSEFYFRISAGDRPLELRSKIFTVIGLAGCNVFYYELRQNNKIKQLENRLSWKKVSALLHQCKQIQSRYADFRIYLCAIYSVLIFW